jgi:hypothetical protein
MSSLWVLIVFVCKIRKKRKRASENWRTGGQIGAVPRGLEDNALHRIRPDRRLAWRLSGRFAAAVGHRTGEGKV